MIPLLLYLLPLIPAIPVDPPAPLPSGGSPDGNLLQFEDSVPVPNDYQICSERGNGYWNKLLETLTSPNAKDRTDGFAPFAEHYVARFEFTQRPESNLADDLDAEAIDADSMDLWVTTDNQPRQKHEDEPYQNYFNTRDGVIMANTNFRGSDKARVLNWSELMYHTWLEAAKWADAQAAYGVHIKGGPISNLKTVIQETVVNKQTQAIIDLMYKNHGLVAGWDRPEDQEWVQWTEVKVPGFWDALMGTDNVRGTVYLLNDHPLEIGKKIITEVWTKWEVFAPDIWVNIGPNPYDEIPDEPEIRCPDERCRKKQKTA
ncbi:MAG: hypothetical protein Q9176_007468 [Flavoplaca citrina]